jgi:Fe2+ or Zn2+ uptake regulation protein
MPSAEETACREELRRAGLPAPRALARLLALLRSASETHLALADVVSIAAKAGLAATPAELGRQLEALADHGMLGRLPTIAAETIFDTVLESHSHLVYEAPAQTVDLHVSPETLLAILRQALVAWPDEVEVLVRLPAPAAGSDINRDRAAANGRAKRQP